MKNQPILFRLLWVCGIAVAAIFIPVVPIRIVLALPDFDTWGEKTGRKSAQTR